MAAPTDAEIIATLKAGDGHDLVILLVPSHEKDNKPLPTGRQSQWADAALELFAELWGGGTALQALKGSYMSDETGEILWDNPVAVESYTDRDRIENSDYLTKLRKFILRMKKDTKQECVMLVINTYRWYL